jgi:DNA polymerase III alpha subunit (gram-positive type)
MTITQAEPADTDAVAAVLAHAFHHDPVVSWLVPDPDRRTTVMPSFFTLIITDAIKTGTVCDADAPGAATVLGQLDSRLAASPPRLLVAHNAPTEAGILHDYHHTCPVLSRTDFLDTVRLARVAYPELGSHRLDVLLHHLRIPWPVDRHRAMPDVEVTAEVLARVLLDEATDGHWSTVNDLRRVALFTAAANRSRQDSLF